MKLLDRLYNLFFRDEKLIDKETLEYYRKHPEELDLIINKDYFNLLFLSVFFLIGVSITITSRIIYFLYHKELGLFMKTVVLDVMSELGIAIFGGALVAYILEFLNKRQYQSNLKFRQQIKALIQEEQEKNAHLSS